MQNFRIFNMPFGSSGQKLILTYRSGVYDKEVLAALNTSYEDQLVLVKHQIDNSDFCGIFYEDSGSLLIHTKNLSNVLLALNASYAAHQWFDMNELTNSQDTSFLYHKVLGWFAVELDDFYKSLTEINNKLTTSTDV